MSKEQFDAIMQAISAAREEINRCCDILDARDERRKNEQEKNRE